jgi:UDP-glucose 4-epimerase
MTILVTGGAGYIGSQMTYRLADAGERVVVLDNLSTGFDWAIPRGVPTVVGDVGDARLLDATIAEHRISAVMHFAASIVVPESVTDPLRYYRNNTVNSRNLIEAAVRGGIQHFIFSSTAAVYGEPTEVPVSEDAPSPAAVSLWLLQADGRDHAAGCGAGARFSLRDPAVFQRGGRRSAAAHRAIDAWRDASDQGCGRDRAGPAAQA